jgi:hypothetical protein
MKHVLSSYANHYGTDLQDDSDMKGKDASRFEELIFPPQQHTSVRKITNNNSFSNSLEHEDTVSKFEKEEGDYLTSNEAIGGRKLEDSKEDETIKNDNKKTKTTKNKSKSKSKHMKSMTFLANEERSEKTSPMPKSPTAHLKSPVSKNNLIKVKTSYKVKVST